MISCDGIGLIDVKVAKRPENMGKIPKTKTPPAGGAGGVLEEIDDLYQI
jgi:hypothetical protein